MSLYKINRTNDYSKRTRFKNVHVGRKEPTKLKRQKQPQDKIFKVKRNLFKLKMKINPPKTEKKTLLQIINSR